MDLAPAARPVRAASAVRTATAQRESPIEDVDASPVPAPGDVPLAPPDSNAADDRLEEDLAAIEARVASITARVGRAPVDSIGDPDLAKAQADFDRALAWKAELLRETNAIVALWTDQRKKDDELLTKEIEMIG